MADVVNWLEQWYAGRCDGDWEHQFGIHIGTLDNPGWSVTIDLVDTKLESSQVPRFGAQISGTDWYQCWVDHGQFRGVGDPTKLGKILSSFMELVVAVNARD